MTEHSDLPVFKNLRSEVGLENAFRQWDLAHRSQEALLVPACDVQEYLCIRQEYRRRVRKEDADIHRNRDMIVTPTGASWHPNEVTLPYLGRRLPFDPPNDQFLREFVLLTYWRTRLRHTEGDFANQKAIALAAAKNGRRSNATLEWLKTFPERIRTIKFELQICREELEWLLPASLTLTETWVVTRITESKISEWSIAFDSELHALEV